MSVLTGFIEVICDGPAEGEGCPENAAWMDAGPARRLRKRMHDADGWKVALPGGVDRCAACAAKAAQR